jgi:hypothetical protein
MAGGVSGAASGGILGLALALLVQQFGYLDFSDLFQAILLLILVVAAFAVVFGIVGRALKGSALRRTKARAAASAAPAEATPPANPPGDSPPPGN